MKTKNIQTIVEYIFALVLALLTYLFFSIVINTEEKYITIPLIKKIDTRFTFIKEPPKSVVVLLRGSRVSLSRISRDDISAVVDFSLYDTGGVYTENVQIIRSGIFRDINNIEVTTNPSNIESNIEKKLTKIVKIIPVFVNAPPPEYGFQGFRVYPSEIKITGPYSVILDIESLETQEINLANETREFTSTVKVVNITNVALNIEPEEVEVVARIQQVITVRTIDDVSIEVINLSEGLILKTDILTASLIIRGRRVNVNNFTPTIVLDAGTIQEGGTYTLIPTVAQENNIEIISLFPTSVDIEVIAKNTDPSEIPALPDINSFDNDTIDDPPISIRHDRNQIDESKVNEEEIVESIPKN